MTPLEHYQEAERLLAVAERSDPYEDECTTVGLRAVGHLLACIATQLTPQVPTLTAVQLSGNPDLGAWHGPAGAGGGR